MNKTNEVKKLETEIKTFETEIKTLVRKLYRKIIAYHRACGMQFIKDEELGIQMYGTAAFGIIWDKDGSFRKVCSLTIKDKDDLYSDLIDETEFKRGDWNPNKEDTNE